MRRQTLRVLAFSALTLVVTWSGWAQAQPFSGECPCHQREIYGTYLGAGIVSVATLPRGEGGFLHEGNGFRLVAGERVSQHVALELNWQRTYHEGDPSTWHRGAGLLRLSTFALDLRLYLSGRGPVQAYFVGGPGVYLVGDAKRVSQSGPGFQGGIGIDFWFTSWLRMGLQAQYRGASVIDRIVDRRLYLSLATGVIEFVVQL